MNDAKKDATTMPYRNTSPVNNISKRAFIDKLLHFARVDGHGIRDEYGHDDYRSHRGVTTLARLIATYLQRSEIEDGWPERNWFLDLPNHLVAAFEAFRTEPEFEVGRKAYALVTKGYALGTKGYEIPNLVDAHAGGTHRLLVSYSMARLMSVLSGEGAWLREACLDRFEAQGHAVEGSWRRFVRRAYAKLIARINTEHHRSNAGTFGATKLMTFACAGRVMITFQRDFGTMTFVADDGDPTGERSGPQSMGAPWQECVDMIDEVTDHWDLDKLQHRTSVRIG